MVTVTYKGQVMPYEQAITLQRQEQQRTTPYTQSQFVHDPSNPLVKYPTSVEIEARANTPEGYTFVGIRQEKAPLVGPIQEGKERPTTSRFVAIYAPEAKEVWASKSYFGPQVTRKATESEKQELTRRYLAGENTYQSLEQRALTGFGLATTTAVGITIPLAGATGLGFVAGGEGVKRIITGKGLTLEEAISLAGIGELSAITALSVRQTLQPRAQARLDTSYRKAIENQELYQPSFSDRLLMKATGARPTRLAQEVVGAGESPPVSFKMLQKGNLGAEAESYFWDNPTPRSSQVYAAKVGSSRAKMWVGEHLIRRVSGGLSYAQIQREIEKPLDRELPFIPKEPLLTKALDVGARGVSSSSILALSATIRTVAVQKPRTLQRTLQRQQLRQRSNTVQSLVQSQELSQTQQQSLRQRTAIIQTQSLSQALKTQQKPINFAPLLPKANFRKLSPPIPRLGSGGGGRGSGLFKINRWFYKKHPVATLEQNLRNVLGSGGKSVKSKSSRKKKRGRQVI